MPIPQRKAFGLRAWRAIDAAVATGVKTYDRADLVPRKATLRVAALDEIC